MSDNSPDCSKMHTHTCLSDTHTLTHTHTHTHTHTWRLMQSHSGLIAAPLRLKVVWRENHNCLPTPTLYHVCNLLRKHLPWHQIWREGEGEGGRGRGREGEGGREREREGGRDGGERVVLKSRQLLKGSLQYVTSHQQSYIYTNQFSMSYSTPRNSKFSPYIPKHTQSHITLCVSE